MIIASQSELVIFIAAIILNMKVMMIEIKIYQLNEIYQLNLSI